MSAAMQQARDVIAEALDSKHVEWEVGGGGHLALCRCGWKGEDFNDHMADLILAALTEQMGLREVYCIAYDGEPSMSGQPHRKQAGADMPREWVDQAWANGLPLSKPPNRRIESRLVTDWQEDEG